MLGQLPAMAMRPFLRGCAVAPMVEACCGTHGGGVVWRPWGNKASMSAAVCCGGHGGMGGGRCRALVLWPVRPMAGVPVLWRPWRGCAVAAMAGCGVAAMVGPWGACCSNHTVPPKFVQGTLHHGAGSHHMAA